MSAQGAAAVRLLLIGLLVAMGAPWPAHAAAQDQDPDAVRADDGTLAQRCSPPEFRQFDFWLGEWEVRNPEGELAGHNEIVRIAQGCGLLERWRGATGGRGTSVNTYEPDRGLWTQRWVGDGATLWLSGGLEEGPDGPRMVLRGREPRPTPEGSVLDRITWRPLEDGHVRQVWEVSADGGESWEEIFRGLYERSSR